MPVEEEGESPLSWDVVESEIALSIAASPEPFVPATVRNAENFVSACRTRVENPVGVAKGYWSTICVTWDGTEVEIFEDRYELYEFRDGTTTIEYFDAIPEGVPEGLMHRLPCRKIEG